MLKIIYPKIITKKDLCNEIALEEKMLFNDVVKNVSKDIIPRANGNLNNKSYWLSSNYDWVIVVDNVNELCLVPLKKEVE